VPDEQEVRLVVLRPGQTYKANDAKSTGLKAADDILANRGGAPRQYRNMLAFLAADRDVMEGLKQESRRFLAWQSVERDQDALNLDAHQRREASEGRSNSDETVRLRFNEAYRWLLVPIQHVANGSVGELEWEATQATGNGDSIVARAARRMRGAEHLIVKWSPALLKMELDRWFWKDQPHVSVKKVWEAIAAYCYLPRLRDQAVFIEAIQEGLTSGDYFGYATSVSADSRYEGLRLGTPAAAVYVDAASVLVKPDVARAQLEARPPGAGPSPQPGELGPGPGPLPPRPPGQPAAPELPTRFFGTAEINPDRAGRDMGQIAEEVLQHLTTLPTSRVRVTVEIEAEVPGGIREDVQRVINENCRTLRFRTQGFEKS
jgi:hypothetical protein